MSEETVAIPAAPPVPPKKTPDKIPQPVSDQTSATLSGEVDDPSRSAADSADSSETEKEVVTKREVKLECASLGDAIPDSFNHGTELSNSKEAEEKPADSEQHLDAGGFVSWSKDIVSELMTNTQLSLDVSDDDEDDSQVSDQTKATQADAQSQVGGKESPRPLPVLNLPPKPLVKVMSASHGDLLLESSTKDAASDDVAKLKLEVSMQVEKTNELLLRLSQLPNMDLEENGSVNLLEEAMEKLKRADVVLTDGKELSPPKNDSKRKSW